MQFEFILTLAAQVTIPGVVRTRTDFGEPDLIAFDEQLNAEDAQIHPNRR